MTSHQENAEVQISIPLRLNSCGISRVLSNADLSYLEVLEWLLPLNEAKLQLVLLVHSRNGAI